jgi:hypothetical protein
MRWTRWRCETSSVTPPSSGSAADRYQVRRVVLVEVFADGEAVWSWSPDAGIKLAGDVLHHAGDGGQKARCSEESAVHAVKTIVQGRPGDTAVPVVRTACQPCCTRAMGAGQHPVFPAPSVLGGTSFRHRPGAIRAAAIQTRDSVVLRSFRNPTASPSNGDSAALKAGITGSP